MIDALFAALLVITAAMCIMEAYQERSFPTHSFPYFAILLLVFFVTATI